MEENLEEFKITLPQKIQSKREVLADAYANCTSDEEPELIYITAGPGAGKSSAERYFQDKLFWTKAIIPFIFNSDKLATYHPKASEALKRLLPQIYYKVTRKFVRPVAPVILEELRNSRISLINENTLDHGESDIEEARKFKEAGYKIKANVIATDIFVSRLSCFEREALDLKRGVTPRGISKESHERMYNSFEPTIRELDRLGLLDEVNVFTRGKTVNDDPILVYEKGDTKYKDFKEAIDVERKRQREILLKNPEQYFERVQRARETIAELGVNEELTQNALKGLDDLEKDFAREVLKHRRAAALEAIEQNGDVKNEIYNLLLTLSNEHRVEDVDDVCDFIEEIDEKYELRIRGKSDISKMYAELCNESEKNAWKKSGRARVRAKTDENEDEYVNTDEEIFSNQDEGLEGVIRRAKERISLYKELLHNIDYCTYEHKLLLGRLKKIQKIYDDIVKQEGELSMMHPTIEDFRE